MKQRQTFRLSAATLALALVTSFGLPALVEAQAVQSSTGSTSTSASSDTTSASSNSTASTTDNSNSTSTSATADSSSSSNLQSRGQGLLAKYREGRKAHTAAEKQQLCKNHEKDLQGKFSTMNGNAQRDQSRINTIFSKAQNYQKSKNVSADNFASLVTTATAAQAKSSNSIAAMKTATPTIDCSGDNAASVATYKAAAQQTQTDLKAYRSDVRAVLQSLLSAKGSN